MSDLATGRTPSFSAAESIALYASSRRTWAKAAQREWKGLTSRLRKHRADVADSAAAAAPDPSAAASGTLGCELPFKFHSPWLKRRLVSAAAILSSYRLMSDLAAGRPGSACEAGVASPDAPAAASKTGDELPFTPLGARAESPQPPAPDFFRFPILLISSEALLALS